MPIGALYSQLFANFFLYDIDQYIVHELKPQIYLRYMDDFIFVDKKEYLVDIQSKIIQKIDKDGLIMVPKKIQMNTIIHGITMLGYRIHVHNQKIIVHVSSLNKKKYWKCVDAMPTESSAWL
ncbi:MAG: RNA-directed DNA polymerase [bacterium]